MRSTVAFKFLAVLACLLIISCSDGKVTSFKNKGLSGKWEDSSTKSTVEIIGRDGLFFLVEQDKEILMAAKDNGAVFLEGKENQTFEYKKSEDMVVMNIVNENGNITGTNLKRKECGACKRPRKASEDKK